MLILKNTLENIEVLCGVQYSTCDIKFRTVSLAQILFFHSLELLPNLKEL
jgi:hypothetical protein